MRQLFDIYKNVAQRCGSGDSYLSSRVKAAQTTSLKVNIITFGLDYELIYAGEIKQIQLCAIVASPT